MAQPSDHIKFTITVTDGKKYTYITLMHTHTWLKQKSHKSLILPKCDILLFFSSILFH